jgi:hypothetical protein
MAGSSLQYLTSNDWILIGARAIRRVFTLGQEIIREEVQSDAIYIIRSGTASVACFRNVKLSDIAADVIEDFKENGYHRVFEPQHPFACLRNSTCGVGFLKRKIGWLKLLFAT